MHCCPWWLPMELQLCSVYWPSFYQEEAGLKSLSRSGRGTKTHKGRYRCHQETVLLAGKFTQFIATQGNGHSAQSSDLRQQMGPGWGRGDCYSLFRVLNSARVQAIGISYSLSGCSNERMNAPGHSELSRQTLRPELQPQRPTVYSNFRES